LVRSEAQVLKRVNAVMRAFGAPPLETLANLLDAQEQFLLTFPELDHYEDRGDERYDGPFYVDDLGEARGWPKGDRPKVLAYFRPGPGLETALESIASSGAVAQCFVPGASAQLAARFAALGINVSAVLLKLKELLPDANATVSYGSHGYLAAALMAGVPCVVLPTDVEKAVLGRRVVALGAGAVVNINRTSDQLRPALEAVLGDARYRDRARAFAQRYAAHRPELLPGRLTAGINDIAIHS
jgi:UDP:flavonoid glycosyltransferase YjiC (YdhE family)